MRVPMNRQAGAALLVSTVILLLVGTSMLFGAGIFRLESDIDRERLTEEKVTRLVKDIAAYVHQNDRIPCPADPAAGDPMDAAFGAEDIQPGPSATRCRREEGLVPYRALNITHQDTLDGWDRHITYAISEVFADTLTNPPTDPNSIFWRCRTAPWIDQRNIALPADDVTKDGFKARFCCPSNNGGFPTAQDLVITGEPPLLRDTTPAKMAQGNVLEAADLGGSVSTWAIALVSHGRNGYGAFAANESLDRVPDPGDAGTAEAENADGDRVFQTALRSYIGGPRHFDDIIAYRTQDQVYAELNNGTCERAWR